MVLTHSKVKAQKKLPIYVKEDNPARKFMSHAEAVEDNKRLRDEREKLEKYKDQLKAERMAGIPGVKIAEEQSKEPTPENMKADDDRKAESDRKEKIIALEAELETIKGS